MQSSIKPSQAPGPEGLKKPAKPPGEGKKTEVRVKKDLEGAISAPPPDKDGPWGGPCDPYATTSPKMVLDRGRP